MIEYDQNNFLCMWKQWILGLLSSSYKAGHMHVAHISDVGTVWPSECAMLYSMVPLYPTAKKFLNKKFVSYCDINKCEDKNLKLLQHKP